MGMGNAASLSNVPVLETERLRLTLPSGTAAGRVCEYFVRNREHLEQWEPARPPRFYSEEFWVRRLRANLDEFRRGQSARFFLSHLGDPDGPVLGAVSFTNFIGGVFQACYLGYSLDHGCQGQGLMTEALDCAIEFVFQDLGLHRVMANYIPSNERSGRLLRRVGFEQEGVGRDYLFIDGEWRDHILMARINDGSKPPLDA